MITPPQNRDQSQFSPQMRRLVDSFMFDNQTDKFFESNGVLPIIIETFRSKERSAWTWGQGRTVEDFQKIKLGAYSQYAQPNLPKVTQLSHPFKTNHYNGTAIDVVVQKNGNIDWNSIHNSEIQKKGVLAGFRSMGAVHGWDTFHYEVPIVYQKGSECQSYAILNLLQKMFEEYRMKSNAECESRALEIYDYLIKNKQPTLLANSLQRAFEMGLFLGRSYRKISFDEIKNAKNILISQRNQVIDETKDGCGIRGHAYVFEFKEDGKCFCRNSHFEKPFFWISEETAKTRCDFWEIF